MKHILAIAFLLLLFTNCSHKGSIQDTQTDAFTSELVELQAFFKIPGLAVSVEKDGESIYRNHLGLSDIEKSIEVDSTTLFPIASITKVFSGVLIMKLVEQGKLSLEEPINNFYNEPILGDSILVKHVLSHTSQGSVGNEFYYSSRFSLLTTVIEKVTRRSFSDVLKREIVIPLNLSNTFLLRDSSQIDRIAKPYMVDDGIQSGFIDYGYSVSAGIVSNLDDLAVFNTALDNNTLISASSRDAMFSSFNGHLPYGYGIFNQQYDNLNIVWAYGQYDCYSSLLLKIPSKKLTLTLLANNNLLSDPARLIYGDITSSLFALSFIKNYVYDLTGMPLLENPTSISNNDHGKKEFFRNKLMAQALAESYMARHQPEKLKSSTKLLDTVFSKFPAYIEYADLSLLHNLSFLKDVAFYMDLGAFNNFDTHITEIGKKLLSSEPNNPYVHSYMGGFYAREKDNDKAKHHFEKIISAQNFSKNWYTMEAQNWLNEI